MRTPHYLRKIKTTTLPTRLIFVDTETKSRKIAKNTEVAELWFGFACYVRRTGPCKWSKPEWIRFDTMAGFWKWVKGKTVKSARTIVFAHNMGFDFTVLKGWKNMSGANWETRKAIIEGPPTILSFTKDGKTLEFIDTLNFFRMSLEKLGKDLGFPKLTMPRGKVDQFAWDEYCKNDVEVIRRAMLYYFQVIYDWDLGIFKATQAAQALTAFRHRFMRHKIFIDDNQQALTLARESYLGGRTECFRLGKYTGEFYLVDINSQYPYIMRQENFPTKLIGYYRRPDRAEILRLIGKYCVTLDCIVKTESPIYPVKHDGRLIFPIGEYRVCLSTVEIGEALARNHIVKFNAMAVYERGHIFREFVDYFYARRLEYKRAGNDVMSFYCKIFMNSLYGKFGQAGRIFETIDDTDPEAVEAWIEFDLVTREKFSYRKFGGVIQRQGKDGESYNSFPAIAAHVTSAARIYLWILIETAGRENVYYVDTDSLLVTAEGYSRLASFMDDELLGALKLEMTVDHINLRGPKDYVMGERERIKGIRPTAIRLSENVYRQPLFVSFRGMIRRGNMDDMVIKMVDKTQHRVYLKGIVGDTGEVSPFRFSL